ncbi:hypothetical protein [Hydrogenophaga sp.]|uniref:hypothetical protein n=1 Tax=Hydrogenophaga sp. TaxID=1904254 RepID=UPI00271E0677|nr:hypothetical protein [Hydrogenophaga sp.]MDO9435009.1 hypothetical protein [Hydrogenophaga sp.]
MTHAKLLKPPESRAQTPNAAEAVTASDPSPYVDLQSADDFLWALKEIPKSPQQPQPCVPQDSSGLSQMVDLSDMLLDGEWRPKAPGVHLSTLRLQRDSLFEAVRECDLPRANRILQDLPSSAYLNQQFPAATPDTFLAETWAPSRRHIPQFRTTVQTYLTHCHQLATWHHWVQDQMAAHAGARAHFSAELRGACNLLRTTHETKLTEKANAGQIARTLQAALKDPLLVQALAQQPFTSIQMMLDRCAILQLHFDSNGLDAFFHDALSPALDLQRHAADMLREALLDDAFEDSKAMPLAMMAFARRVTAWPQDELSTNTTLEQRRTIAVRVGQWHRRVETAPASRGSWANTVLKRLSIDADKAVHKKIGPLSMTGVSSGDYDDNT